jgi:hypothetical protein
MSGPWIVAFGCLWLVVLLIGFSVVGVVRRISGVLEGSERLLAREIEGAEPLSLIPPFELIDEVGDLVSSQAVITETTLLLFMDSHCGPCQVLLSDLTRHGDELGRVPIVVVADEEGLADGFQLPPTVSVFRQRQREVARLFRSVATPQAFVVDSAGVVLDRTVPGSAADLRRMAARQEQNLSAPREGRRLTAAAEPERGDSRARSRAQG